MSMPNRTRKPYDFWKRLIDILFSVAGLIVLSPVLAVTALLVRKNLGSPVIFKQARPGKDGKIFTMYKFRSMLDVDEELGLITDEHRLTKFGKLLRSTSLDELPELWNVLKGDMSLVGPRPLLARYLERYTPDQARRHEVRPGITGLAQVQGRNDLTWKEKFYYDIYYVDNRSLSFDLRIIFLTLLTVLRRDGVSKSGQATTNEFFGED